MRVPHSEGVANHTDPLSCVGHREVSGEALAGESIGQPDGRDIARSGPIPRGQSPWHVRTLLEREPGGLTRDRLCLHGPDREGKEP